MEQKRLKEGDVVMTKETLEHYIELVNFKEAFEDEWKKWKNKQLCTNCHKDMEIWTPVVVTHLYGSEYDGEEHIFCSVKCCSEYYDKVKYNEG